MMNNAHIDLDEIREWTPSATLGDPAPIFSIGPATLATTLAFELPR